MLRPKGKSLSILKTNTVTEFYSHLITLAHHSVLTHRNLEVLKIGHGANGIGSRKQDLRKNSLQLLFLGVLGVLGGSFFHDFA
ncbi:hypothetical protein LC605_15745 [Nostoc sp. CHAB 5836]|nr:hypothetical protein [Nostoc sp. CHAB 5836]